MGLGRYAESEAACRTAIDLTPELADAWSSLGIALMQQARLHEAMASLNKAIDLLPSATPLRDQAQRFVEQCQRLEVLDTQLPAILEGSAKPASAGEQIELARLCVLKKLDAAAARFYADAFARAPRLADEPGDRYNASCSAALAGCGRSQDGIELDEAERAHWRAQARTWLRKELDRWRAAPTTEAREHQLVRRMLTHWKIDPDLAGLRDPDSIRGLPQAERDECLAIWSDVDAILDRLQPQ